jgi:hypothetical protein
MAAAVPTFAGQAIFGDEFSFFAAPLAAQNPAGVDAWLSLSPGTTQYGPPPGGQLWGLSGTLIGSSSGAVGALQATLASFAGTPGVFLWPTADPANPTVNEPNCYFSAAEIVYALGGIINVGGTYVIHDDGTTDTIGGQWQVGYTMILRQLAQS